MILHHFPLCPFSRKVRVVLAEKGLAADGQTLEPWQDGERLARLNAALEVPVLVDHDYPIADSWVICDYLEETQRGPSLLGKTALERAETRRIAAWFHTKFAREVTEPIWGEKLIKRVRDKATPNSAAVRAGLANIHLHLDYITYLFEQRNWLAGDGISLADITAATQLSVLDYLGDVPWDQHPDAKLWYAKIKSRPSFRPLLADRLPLLKPAAHYDDLDF